MTYVIGVLREFGPEYHYRVKASTPDDALVMAFCMDGGCNASKDWTTVQDETGIIELAKAYCRVVRVYE